MHQISEFKANFDGKIVLPGETGYDAASIVYARKGSPAMVVQPRSAAAVARAVTYAQENNLEIAVRSGGHSGAGFSTNDGGMVIDMALIDQVEVLDIDKQVVRVGSGALWRDVARALQPHGLAISSGDTGTVGVGGLTLGGGVGWMVREYGLTIDNIVSAEVVVADGRVLKADNHENTDLFWAVRGGGGNFGIVTRFEFKAQAISKVHFGSIVYESEDLFSLLRGWRDFMREAPPQLTTSFLILPQFDDNPASVTVHCCYSGKDPSIIDSLLSIGKVMQNDVTEKNYADILEDGHHPQGQKIILNSAAIPDFSDDALRVVANQATDNNLVLQIRNVGGALNKVPANATAFALRDSEVLIISPIFMPANATPQQLKEAQVPWREIAAFGNGAYCNFINLNSGKEVGMIYPPATLARLREVKRHYDPQNIFHGNYNILASLGQP